jgi:hypothetical protein
VTASRAIHDNDDDFLATFWAGVDRTQLLPSRERPPPGLKSSRFGDPVTARAGRLLERMLTEPHDVLHFPAHPVLQEVEHRGARIPFVLVGLRAFTPAKDFFQRTPWVGDGVTRGAVVELDGVDILCDPPRWHHEHDGYESTLSSYTEADDGLLVTVTGAIPAVEGMTITRYVVAQDGQRVTGSEESWVVEGGQVRRVCQ